MKKTNRFTLFIFLTLGGIFTNIHTLASTPTSTSPLFGYSWGISGGAVYAMNEDLRETSEQFLKLSLNNNIYVSDYTNLFLDVDWFLPGNNFGGNLGLDFLAGQGKVRPLMGMGVGAHIFEREDRPFGKNIGASVTAHIGMLAEISNSLQFRIRIPYHIVTNDPRDNTIGLDVGVLFSSPWKNVRQLHY